MDTATVRCFACSLRMAGVRVTRLRRRGRLGFVLEATTRLGGKLTITSGSLEDALTTLFGAVSASMYVLGRELTSGITSGLPYGTCQQGHPVDRWAYECRGCSGSLLGAARAAS